MIKLTDHFDFTRLSKIPRWVYFLWLSYFLLVLVCMFQEATNLFYGPIRSVQGNGMLLRCDVSNGWAYTSLYLPVGLAWFVMICARTRLAMVFTLLGLIAFLMIGGSVAHELAWTGGTSMGWHYNGIPASGLLSYETVVEFVADPAGEIWFFVNILLMTVWSLGILIWKGFYHYPLLPPGGVCRECGYDLRGTSSMICPECGCDNRTKKESEI